MSGVELLEDNPLIGDERTDRMLTPVPFRNRDVIVQTGVSSPYGSSPLPRCISMHNVSQIQSHRFSMILLTAAFTSVSADPGHAHAISADISNAAPRLQRHTGERSAADQSGGEPACLTSGSKGVWGQYSAHDLPRGSCSATNSCILWTKDSCLGTDSPGPTIKWECACASGVWRCDEQERSKTVCPTR